MLIVFPQLFLLAFLINHVDIGFLVMLYITISMSLKLKEEDQVLPSFENLMDDDSIIGDELSLLASNIRREVINVLDFFLWFL